MNFLKNVTNKLPSIGRLDFNLEDFVRNISVKKILATLTATLIILGTYLVGSSTANLTGVLMFMPELFSQKYVPPEVEHVDRPKELIAYEGSVMDNTFATEPAPPDTLSKGDSAGASLSIEDFELKGTLVLGFFESNAYIRQISKNAEQFFLIGDQIFDSGYRLLKVFQTHVILERNGTEIELKIEEEMTFDKLTQLASADSGGGSTPSKPTPSAPTPQKSAEIIQRVETGKAPVINIANGKADVVVSSNDIENNLKNFTELLQQARVIPKNDEGGNLKGFLIRDIEKGSFYEQIGLQDQDVIKSVNGNEIDSPEKALTLFQLMRNEKQINLIIERDGQNVAFNYFIQ